MRKKKLFFIIAEIVVFILGSWLLYVELSSGEVNSGLREYRENEEVLPFWYSILLFAGCLAVVLFHIFRDILKLLKDK